MRRRRVVWVLGTLAVVGFLFWWGGDLAHGRRLATENYSLIRPGMTQAEVEELFGGPPGNYGRYLPPETFSLIGYSVHQRLNWSVALDWYDDSHYFEILFDANGRVVGHLQKDYCQWEGSLERWWRKIGF
jgi:hypothetical protein